MDIERIQVISTFCELSDSVAREAFGHRTPADCFCYEPSHPHLRHFDSRVLDYIEEAVRHQLELDRIRKEPMP